MPIYEYSCPTCNAEFEVLIRRDSDKPTACPTCGKGKPVKAFSTFAAVSSGSAMPSCADACASAGDACRSGGCPGGMCGMG